MHRPMVWNKRMLSVMLIESFIGKREKEKKRKEIYDLTNVTMMKFEINDSYVCLHQTSRGTNKINLNIYSISSYKNVT